MAVSTDSIQSICNAITREIEQVYEGLSLFFVIHRQGKMREAIALAEHEIVSHPAGNAARAIIQKHTKGSRSSFLGIAIANESKMFGFKKKDHLLGLFNINEDHFDNPLEAKRKIYHLVWHAIDLYEIRQEPAYKRKFKSGPMVPKRSALNLSKANLQADVFATVLSVLKSTNNISDKHAGQKDHKKMIKQIAQKRGIMSLKAINDYKAEDYPSVIAKESCEFVLNEIMDAPPEKDEQILVARKVSLDVGHAFDENNIQQWWDFSIPAQDMAWRGFKKEEILGAAVNTSDNPFVRSVGYLIQEVTNIEPVTAASLEHSYNAFVDPDTNMNLHREMVDTIFEEAVQRGVEEKSSRPFKDAANRQNEELTEGRILGWCANALQDAAKAFERALLNGASPDQAARMHFEGGKEDRASWNTLKELGDSIVDQHRQGFAVTMGHVAEICHNHPAFAPVLDSLKITMNDPSYVQALEASNDLAIKPAAPAPAALAPKGPAPKGLAPTAPELAAAPVMPAPAAGPSLGGNNRAAQIMRQRQLAAQQQKQKEEQGSSETT